MAELDWISGFVNRGSGLEIEAVFTPLAQDFEFDECGLRIRYSTTRMKKPVLRRCPLWAISSLALGNHVLRTREQRPRRLVTLTKAYDHAFRDIRPFHRSVTINDTNSSVLTFEQLLDADPSAADVIWGHAPCPKYTAFFVCYDGHKAIMIPTSEILRSCYLASARVLEALFNDDAARAYADIIAEFNGYVFTDNARKWYPFRRDAGQERGLWELRQLLPRACAYSRSKGGALPILIRPPFTGRVSIRGQGLTEHRSGREYNVFLRALEYRSLYEHRSKKPRPFDWMRDRMAFAPWFLGNDYELTSINARAPHDQGNKLDRFDARFFYNQQCRMENYYGAKKLHRYFERLLFPQLATERSRLTREASRELNPPISDMEKTLHIQKMLGL